MPKETHKYSNGEVTVIWKPTQCIHSKICWTQLRDVFDPTKRPWVNMTGADTQAIIDQVKKCPSGALSFVMNEEAETRTEESASASITNIEILPNGPILIKTNCQISFSNGETTVKEGVTALCRCGASKNKPYCDGSHSRIGFVAD
jgi:uncharacterized Fe-S cluster protein YjdI